MSSGDWLSKIEQMRQREKEIEANAKAKEKAWEELKEKYRGEATKIIELLNSELEKVVDVYTDPSLQDYDKPKVEGDNRYVKLNIPIVRGGSHYSFGISFWLKLTEKGYGLDIVKTTYFARDDKPYEYKSSIPPPITVSVIQKEVMEVLQARNEAITVLAEKEDKFRKGWG